MGCFIVNNGTVQRMVGISDGGTFVGMSYTDDGTTFNIHSPSVTAFDHNRAPGICFGNKIYFPVNSSTRKILECDPVAGTATLISFGDAVGATGICVDLCVYDDRLFVLCPGPKNAGVSLSDWQIYEFTGGGFSLNTVVTTGNQAAAHTSIRRGQPCLFKEPSSDKLIAIVNGTDNVSWVGNAGSQAFELTPSGSAFTVVDLTNTVIPAGLRPAARGSGTDPLEDRWLCYTNNDTIGTPDTFLFVAPGPAPGTGYSVYTWNGVGSEMTLLAAGPTTSYALPHQKFGGGERINRTDANQFIIEDDEPVVGGWKLSGRVYGTKSGQELSFYYSDSQGTPTGSKATITAQTGGSSISGGNTVLGITGDDGSTLFTATLDIIADGIPSGDAVHVVADLQIT